MDSREHLTKLVMDDFNNLFKQMCEEDEVTYQHQESPNEDYFECKNSYLDGTWCN